ncbi:FHA domain-containing protein [Streptosporangium sp. KLBMP 9127]|nr:FHA domain-containing protein [Streptosporangium sp. KLBMP 9127]
MATCPSGHESDSTDYCDICGTMMSGSPASAPAAAPVTPAAAGEGRSSCPDCEAPRTGRFCEECGYDFAVEVSGSVRMAEQAAQAQVQVQTQSQALRDPRFAPGPGSASAQQPSGGYLSAPVGTGAYLPAPGGTAAMPLPGVWEAVVTADRAYYETIIGQGGPDASSVPFPPYCPERRFPLHGQQVRIGRHSRSRGLTPEIDLSGPPEDPGVSHLHAVLLSQPDGSWLLVDPGSANGTTVGGSADLLEPNVPVPVGDGDRIQLGAWTVITLRKG